MIARLVETTTVADLLHALGDIAPARIRLCPQPTTATELDLEKAGKCIELVDGTLVEKPMGFGESELTGAILTNLRNFVRTNRLGRVGGADGGVKLEENRIRIPDVSFYRKGRLPKRSECRAFAEVAPDLAVEVLSPSNTPAEMKLKRKHYFEAGVRLVWIVDPVKRTVDVYTSKTKYRTLTEEDTLDGGEVLPGFELPLRELFAEDEE
jgi:Uma2 family endonuclease